MPCEKHTDGIQHVSESVGDTSAGWFYTYIYVCIIQINNLRVKLNEIAAKTKAVVLLKPKYWLGHPGIIYFHRRWPVRWFLFQPKYWSSHPENYLISLSKKYNFWIKVSPKMNLILNTEAFILQCTVGEAHQWCRAREQVGWRRRCRPLPKKSRSRLPKWCTHPTW